MSLQCAALVENVPEKYMEVAMGSEITLGAVSIFILHGTAGKYLNNSIQFLSDTADTQAHIPPESFNARKNMTNCMKLTLHQLGLGLALDWFVLLSPGYVK